MKKLILLSVLLLFTLALATSYSSSSSHKHFLTFLSKYSKHYASDEEFISRFQIFQDNLKRIDQYNEEANGLTTFGITHFADETPEELNRKYLMPLQTPPTPDEIWTPEETLGLTAPPTTWDWRKRGCISPVRSQGNCGSCWAFAATANIESVYNLSGRPLPILAPQQIVDCDIGMGSEGCNGGATETAYNYVARAGGQDTEKSYPYKGNNGVCRFNRATIGAQIKGYKRIPNVETTIQDALTTTSPFSICLSAPNSWFHYTGGVLLASNCPSGFGHCVQLVGYDATAKPPYWIAKNQWGLDFGIKGYINLEMWKNTCGMKDDVNTAYV